MKELNLFNGLTDGSVEQTMSSREIAELTNKRHDNVLRDIDALNESYGKLHLLKIEESFITRELPNGGSKTERTFNLTRMQTMDLMTGYNSELRIKVNRRWMELEKSQSKINLPKTYSEALRELADAAEKVEKLELQAKEDAPKVLFSDAVSTSRSSCLIGELAKLVRQNGVDIGQNRLFQWMRDNGYLCLFGERRNQPTQKAMDLELFEVKKVSVEKPSGEMLITTTTKVTGKGQIYFVNKFLKSGVEDLVSDKSLKTGR